METSNQQLEKNDINSITLEMAAGRAEFLQQIVAAILTPGIDYGTVPGVPEPFLKKPGAQKLLAHFQLRADPELKASHEDWAKGVFFYRYRAAIYNRNGQIVGAAERGCTNQEDKFKFRWQNAPEHSKEEMQAMTAAKTGRWIPDGSFWQWQEKEEIPNPYDQVNNVIARAQKRAVSAAVENVFAAAGFFASEGAKAKTKSGTKEKKDDGATAFWLKAKGDRIADAVARPLADEATAGKITWKQAIERLPKPETTTNNKEQ